MSLKEISCGLVHTSSAYENTSFGESSDLHGQGPSNDLVDLWGGGGGGGGGREQQNYLNCLIKNSVKA